MDDINATLIDDLLNHFDEPELRQFCQQLGEVAYDDLAGDEPHTKITHLVNYLERRGRRRRLARQLVTLQPHLAPQYQSLLRELDRIRSQAAAIDDALSWLDELAAGQGAALEEPPTTTWPTQQNTEPRAQPDSKLSWIDSLAQGSGLSVEEEPTMTWLEEDDATTLPPYQVGGRISSPAYFFGRESERQWLRTRLLEMGSSVIVGLPYSGKSSLLHALVFDEPLPPEHHFLLAYVSLENGRFPYQSQVELLNAIWLQWLGHVRRMHQQADLPAVAAIGQLSDFAHHVQTLQQQGYRPVVCLDGFMPAAGQTGLVDEALLTAWHDLGNTGHIAFVLTAERPLASILPNTWLRTGFDTIFYQLEIGLLSPESAWSLLTEPARKRGIDMPSPLVERWLDYCGAYPIFLQMAGSLLWETLADQGFVSSGVEAALQYKFRQWAKPYWHRMWQALSAEARHAFPRRPTTPTTPAAKVVYRFLAGRGLLVPDGAQYRPFSSAFAQWLERDHPQSATVAPADQVQAEGQADTGWLRRLWADKS